MSEATAALIPDLPRPPVTDRRRSQLETFLVMRRNPLELWGDLAYTHFVLPGRFLGRAQLNVNEPDAIRHVLVTNHENYGRNIGTKRILRPVIGSGLFLAEGNAWRHQRRTIAPALAPRTMPLLGSHVMAAVDAKESELRRIGGRPVELLPHLQALTLAIAGESMFSLPTAGFGTEMRAMMMRYGRRYVKVGVLDLLLPATVPTPLDLGRALFRKSWLRLMDRLIDAREAQPTEAADGPRDLFDLLASARDPETGQRFDRAQLRDEISTLILAGHETTAVALFWACFIAARLPEHQERIAAEASAAFPAAEAAAALKALPFTRAFVDETLRLYPPAYLITREARGHDTVGGRTVVPGTVISISPWVLHRHRRLWRDPDRFDPSRFLPGAEPPDRFAYLPFGAGPRICVGAQFALLEAVLVLARLLSAFHLRLASGTDVVPIGRVTTQPDRPVRFALTDRRPRS
ncbi:MAG TPA: cytochrome P450 [Acetobacteraceae bacterium]|nr:cytochrome P450 [Acetobacteraceae bacterium]